VQTFKRKISSKSKKTAIFLPKGAFLRFNHVILHADKQQKE
jgi:hypothetical protein